MTARLALLLVVAACGSKAPARPVERPPPTCIAAADHVLDLVEPKDDRARKVRDIFQRRCEQDAWSAEARTCVVETTSLKDPRGCKARLSPPQRDALERELAEADRVARSSKLPGSCAQYKERIAKLMTCDKLPQESRDALKQGMDEMEQSWGNMKDLPPEAQQAIEDGCKAGVEALDQAVKALCGW